MEKQGKLSVNYDHVFLTLSLNRQTPSTALGTASANFSNQFTDYEEFRMSLPVKMRSRLVRLFENGF